MKISLLHLQRLNSRVLNLHEIVGKNIYLKPQKHGISEAKHTPWINVQVNLHFQAVQGLSTCVSTKLVASLRTLRFRLWSPSQAHTFLTGLCWARRYYGVSAQDLSPQSHGLSGLNVTYCPGVGQCSFRRLNYTQGKLLTLSVHILFIQRKFCISNFVTVETGWSLQNLRPALFLSLCHLSDSV